MKIFSALVLALATAVGFAQPSLPVTTTQALEAIADRALVEPSDERLHEALAGEFPVAWMRGTCTVGFLGRTAADWSPALAPEGVTWGSERGGIVSFRVYVRQLDALTDLPLELVELAPRAYPHLDRSIGATRVDSVQAGYGLPQGYHGENVLIGVVDWGFDYTHPMFYDTTLAFSRVRGVWDQWRQAGPAPEGFDYGTAATEPAAIAALQADTVNVYSYATHGTHVAGIAGGSGAGIGLRGMAPAAEFLFATFLIDAAAAMDAFDWMQSVAEADGKRLVINMSFGLTQIGSRDGNSLVNQFIDALSEEGVVFAGSAGNNGDSNFHLDQTFSGDTLRSRVQYYPASANPAMWGQDLTLWGEPGEPFEAGFTLLSAMNATLAEGPWLSTADGPFAWDTTFVHEGDTIVYTAAVEAAHPANDRPFVRMRIATPPANRNIALKVTAPSGRVHAWNTTHLSNGVGNWGQDFYGSLPGWTAGNPEYGIGDPASTESVITVAAYRAEYFSPGGTELGGEVAYFTTHGPTLDERHKPDLAAPGVSVLSSISSFTDANFALAEEAEFNGTPYPFARYSGTSMSSPTVAGIAALLLEADPTLTPAAIRATLKATARQDDETGVLPVEGDAVWGVGKVNAYAAVLAVLGINDVAEPVAWTEAGMVWPNPARDELSVRCPETTGTCRIHDLQGRTVAERAFRPGEVWRFDVAGLPGGTYLVIWHGKNGTHLTRFTKS